MLFRLGRNALHRIGTRLPDKSLLLPPAPFYANTTDAWYILPTMHMNILEYIYTGQHKTSVVHKSSVDKLARFIGLIYRVSQGVESKQYLAGTLVKNKNIRQY